ncbi:cell death abnormality protein 1-like [Ctenocephalides felis]|uniref:cell death abnormality protein 1-like n=1 Tax=Ctenocephalides felis TaxID=7515 RepID=UPI000E6E55C1|nr:cell death abnormality protein 1-like [Ctenocephalides felis]
MAALCSVRCLIALALVALVSYVTSQVDDGFSRALDDRCNYDQDCRMKNVFCDQSQGKCVCKKGFRLTKERNDCIAAVGAICMSDQECASLPNSRCDSGICVCKFNFVPHPEDPICLERKQLGEHCNVGEQCHTKFNFNAHCVREVCVCREDHHESRNRTCIQSKGYNQNCVDDIECFIGEEYRDRIRCFQNKCLCKPEFPVTEDGKCGSGAPGTQVWSSVMTLAVMASVAKIITM